MNANQVNNQTRPLQDISKLLQWVLKTFNDFHFKIVDTRLVVSFSSLKIIAFKN